MDKILYNAMLSRIQKEIKNHKEEINKLKEIDLNHCKMKIGIEKFLEIIEAYKEIEIGNKRTEISVFCNGNPYTVLNLAMISILNNMNMNIDIEGMMLGVNSYIIEIINNIIRENNLEVKINIAKRVEDNEDIICIDRINEYRILKKKGKEVRYIPYKSIDIYSEAEEFEELFEKVYIYAIDMNIDVDVFDEEGIEGLFKHGKGKNKLILTKDKAILDKYKKENVYINENPFKEEKVIFDRDIIREIIK